MLEEVTLREFLSNTLNSDAPLVGKSEYKQNFEIKQHVLWILVMSAATLLNQCNAQSAGKKSNTVIFLVSYLNIPFIRTFFPLFK